MKTPIKTQQIETVRPRVSWQETDCNLCGHHDTEVYERERVPYFDSELEFKIVRCRHCGLVYTNPRIEDANAVYEQDDEFSDQGVEDHAHAKMPVFQAALKRLEGHLGSQTDRHRMLLDIGCGGGHFMNLARQRGFCAAGLEPASLPAAYAHRHFGLEVVQATVEEATWPEESFDAISAFDVIEHVTDPKTMLRQCVQWLRPGGVMVLRFPSAGWQKFKAGIYHLIPGCRQWSFGPAMHLYFFSRATFSRLAEEAGLEVIEFRLTPMEIGRGSGIRGRIKRACDLILKLIFTLTGYIPGNIEVYCRKPKT